MNHPKKRVTSQSAWLLTIVLCCIANLLIAQDWIGFNTDNYAGVHRMQVQPASIVGGPYKLDVNILSADFFALNTEYFSNLSAVESVSGDGTDGLLDIFKEGKNEYLANGNVLLPSFILQLKDKSAIGFSFKARGNFFLKASDSDLANLILNDFELEEFYGTQFEDTYATTRYATWSEYNFTYAREVMNTESARLKIGITPKLIVGQGAGYLSADDLAFRLESADILADLKGDLQFGYNEGLDETLNGEGVKLFGKATFGLNIGAEYEIKSKDTPSAKGRINYDPGYKLKIGVSFSDFGSLKYEKADKSSDYRADISNFPLNSIRDVESIDELADTLSQFFTKTGSDSEFKMRLPSSLRLQFDYKLANSFYVNYSANLAITGKDREVFETRNLGVHALTFRYERPRFGVSLPLYYNSILKLNSGLALRLGPVVFGSGNIISGLVNGDAEFLNLYFGFKVPIINRKYKMAK